jgi:hypothetical protein
MASRTTGTATAKAAVHGQKRRGLTFHDNRFEQSPG